MSKKIEKSDWSSNFTLIGTPKISEEYTFKINEHSQNSDWIYNAINLGIDCGEKFGTVYADMMGGFSEANGATIYAHGKKDDNTDDFKSQIEIAWEDRFKEEIIEQVGDFCFITVGLEKTKQNKTFYKKFLSQYDAIEYIKEHLTDDMVVNVKGNVKYSEYNGTVQMKKNITSIVLSSVDDPKDFTANFTQTVLIDKYSADLKNIDKDKGVMYVDAIVLDYLKEKDGVEIKGQYPYLKQFELEMPLSDEAKCKKIVDKLFKVKKGYTQITFLGNFIEGGATVQATMDDVPDDIKDLIDMGVYTEEEALKRCSSNGNREHRMLLKQPYIKLVGDDKLPVLQKFDERYAEEDIDMFTNATDSSDIPFTEGKTETASEGTDDLAWMNNL